MGPEAVERHKVFAYITRGTRIAVFDHANHPEAGTQVPAGTLRAGEDVVAGALREAFEESGLHGLRALTVLGETVMDMRPWGKAEIHHRTFVHLHAPDTGPDAWEHWEEDPHGEAGQRYRFVFRWVPLAEAERVLIAGHGALLGELEGAVKLR